MKKLFSKRMLAFFVDILVFAFFYELFHGYITTFVATTHSWGYFVVFIPFVVRDLLFRHASLGKKLVGLIVVDVNWSMPSAFAVIKRSVATTAFGNILLIRLRMLNEDKEMTLLAEAEWEYRYLKARVVDKKVYQALKNRSSNGGKIDVSLMDQLYKQYLYE